MRCHLCKDFSQAGQEFGITGTRITVVVNKALPKVPIDSTLSCKRKPESR